MEINNVASHPAVPVQSKPQGQPVDKDGDHDNSTEPSPAESKTSGAPKDSVQISTASQKLLQEATETPAQTALEAASGDAQARRLLAREEERKAANAPPPSVKGGSFDVNA